MENGRELFDVECEWPAGFDKVALFLPGEGYDWKPPEAVLPVVITPSRTAADRCNTVLLYTSYAAPERKRQVSSCQGFLTKKYNMSRQHA
ncbi:hypothetical protein C4813_24275 [Salmonella enterica subsp. enterica serovar Rubislaw]|nr:hypothetical protein C4813_24275 [Salmonella enterica subsp. enterica serovar Rubislaw]